MNGLNQYDYGARRRGAGLPIWTGMDPLAEKYYSISPYAYCHNNPVNRIDPDGKNDKNGIKTEPNKINGVSISAQSTTGGNEPRVIRSTPIKKLTPMQQAMKTSQSQPRGEIKDANQEKFKEMHNEAMNDPIKKQCLTDPTLQLSASVILGGGPEAIVSTATKTYLTLSTTTTLKATATTFVAGFIEGAAKSYLNAPPDTPYLIPGQVFQNGSDLGGFSVSQFNYYINSFSSPQSNQPQP